MQNKFPNFNIVVHLYHLKIIYYRKYADVYKRKKCTSFINYMSKENPSA